MKDIFIDAQVANLFAEPPNEHYQKLIDWLYFYDKENKDNSAFLVVSTKLIGEYFGGNKNCAERNSITSIFNALLIDERLTWIDPNDIKGFQKKYFKHFRFRCGWKDRNHMPLIFLSVRKFALADDDNFLHDLVNFPKWGKQVNAQRYPENLPYKG